MTSWRSPRSVSTFFPRVTGPTCLSSGPRPCDTGRERRRRRAQPAPPLIFMSRGPAFEGSMSTCRRRRKPGRLSDFRAGPCMERQETTRHGVASAFGRTDGRSSRRTKQVLVIRTWRRSHVTSQLPHRHQGRHSCHTSVFCGNTGDRSDMATRDTHPLTSWKH